MTVFYIKQGIVPFLSAVFDAYSSKIFPDVITTEKTFAQTFDTCFYEPEQNEEHALRVKKAIIKYGGKQTYEDIKDCLRSCSGAKETTAYEYVRLLLKEKRYIGTMFSETAVLNFVDTVKKVRNEVHRMYGFLRFTELENGNYYAHYTPDNDVTDLIIPHFAERLKNCKFAIHDTRRGIIGIYDGKNYKVFRTDRMAEITLSEEEKKMQNLWTEYYSSVNVKERKNKKTQDNYLPLRYRENMTEFEPKT